VLPTEPEKPRATEGEVVMRSLWKS